MNASKEVIKKGELLVYHCHAGLIDFSTPITIEDEIVGFMAAGQILTEPLEEEYVRELAREFGIDEGLYVEAAKKIPVLSEQRVNDVISVVQQLANVISNMGNIVVNNIKIREEAENIAKQKSDFLANMSHEIRTPMNAVIGMAEMALREKLPDKAKEYLYQIKSSGKTLLTIINDILDFSKIESGKLEIIEEEYEFLSIVNDVINIIYARIGDKNIEFLVEVNPNIPHKLLGDHVRINQIIMNLANNAVKFTSSGAVTLKFDYEDTEDGILLLGDVIDTGIGIKKENLNMLFQSFQQLDSKRNRNVEGTGLGLALTRKLLDLMNGSVKVDSTYGKGSTFSFSIPQIVASKENCIHIQNYSNLKIAGCFNSYFVKNSFLKIMRQFKIGNYFDCETTEDILHAIQEDVDFFFVEYSYYSDYMKELVFNNDKTEICVVVDGRFQHINVSNRVSVLHKPLYALNVAATLNHEKTTIYNNSEEVEQNTFVIPEAEVLIVDDNSVNLTVAEGLLRIYMANITTVMSGKEAIEIVQNKDFDLIFMDHMMPEMDGVEATHRIRELGPKYEKIPIIALTANALREASEMFLAEGLNDFVAKPIEMREIGEILKKWIPKELQVAKKVTKRDLYDASNQATIKISGLNTADGCRYTGSLELYKYALKDYYKSIEEKANKIAMFENQEDLKNYTIEVHALKSASRMIGANELAKFAEKLEACGNEGNWKKIHNETNAMLALYRNYIPILAPYFGEEVEEIQEKEDIDKNILLELLEKLGIYMEELDLDGAEEVCNELRKYKFSDGEENYFNELLTCIEKIDFENGKQIIDDWTKSKYDHS